MIKKNKFLYLPVAACVCSLFLNGCSSIGLAQESSFDSAYENGEEEEPADIYTSSATVIVQAVDAENKALTVHMIERNEGRTFTYTGATSVQDKYGSIMSMAQIMPGDIADIQYNGDLDKIGSVTLSADAWSRQDISRYNLDIGNDSASIGEENFSVNNNVQVFSEGKPITTDQIIHQDVLSFHGMGSSIMSITVDQGHGYLKLENDEAVLGGWIEIGQTLISQISPDMLFTVPEGSYTVRFSAPGVEETREVIIERNKETVLDLSDIEVPQPEKGLVTVKVTPASAKVLIDEKTVDITYPLRLPVGLHQITASASGYDTVSEYFQVDGEKMTVSLELGESSTTVSGNGIFNRDEEEATITIQAPADVEVYQDNLYMGIAPVTYKKTAGSHVITLRKEGYVTRSHDIEVPDDDKDVTYSFPDLELSSSADNSGTVSGNSINNNTVSGNSIENNKQTSQTPNPSDQNTVSGNTVSGNTVSGNSADEEDDDAKEEGN